MADAVQTLGVAGRPTTPSELLRQISPDQPVLLVGPDAIWESTGVAGCLEAAGWPSVTRVRRRTRVRGSRRSSGCRWCSWRATPRWCGRRSRRSGRSRWPRLSCWPMLRPTDVVALVGAGVDAVVDPATGADEVFARVVALLRRSEHGWGPGVRSLESGGLRVDLWSQECSLDGELLQLSPTEYALLTFLMTHPGQALPTHTIVREVWGWFTSDGKNVLRIFVNRLRRKLHDDFRNPQFIASVRGTGYRFIRNVAEIGDGADPAVERTDVTLLLQSVEQLAVGLLDATTVDAAGAVLLDALDDTGYADGMAVFRLDGNRMQLVGGAQHAAHLDGECRRRRAAEAGVRECAERAHAARWCSSATSGRWPDTSARPRSSSALQGTARACSFPSCAATGFGATSAWCAAHASRSIPRAPRTSAPSARCSCSPLTTWIGNHPSPNVVKTVARVKTRKGSGR